VLFGVLGQHQDIATVMAAPPLLGSFDPSGAVSIPQGAYGSDFTAKLKALGVNLIETPGATAAALRGTLAAVAIDPETGRRKAVNQPGMMVFNGTD
jgi:hypothetical protein